MPQFINIFELARRGETIEGEVAVKDLPNLLGFTATENGTLRFVATGLGERRGLPAVDLDMEGDVDISCARCLKPMSVHIASGAVFRLVRTEAEANALPIEDDEEDEDVLVGSRSFDLEKWVEEEEIFWRCRAWSCMMPAKKSANGATGKNRRKRSAPIPSQLWRL